MILWLGVGALTIESVSRSQIFDTGIEASSDKSERRVLICTLVKPLEPAGRPRPRFATGVSLTVSALLLVFIVVKFLSQKMGKSRGSLVFIQNNVCVKRN